MAERILPLTYKYDAENEKLVEFLEVVSNYCGATDDGDKLPSEPEKLWPFVWQALRLISSVTCWDDAPEDLFLTQTRTQTYAVDVQCACVSCKMCDDEFVIVPLEYSPHSEDFYVSGKISGMIKGEFVEEEISEEFFVKHFDKGQDRFYIPKSEFYKLVKEYDPCCKCSYKMLVTLEYNAGYDAIPAGLLPAICYILNKVDNGVNDEDCHDNLTLTSGLLKRKKVGNVEYEWSTQDTTNSKTATLYSDLHDLGMLDEVMALSRCAIATQQEVIGDVV